MTDRGASSQSLGSRTRTWELQDISVYSHSHFLPLPLPQCFSPTSLVFLPSFLSPSPCLFVSMPHRMDMSPNIGEDGSHVLTFSIKLLRRKLLFNDCNINIYQYLNRLIVKDLMTIGIIYVAEGMIFWELPSSWSNAYSCGKEVRRWNWGSKVS